MYLTLELLLCSTRFSFNKFTSENVHIASILIMPKTKLISSSKLPNFGRFRPEVCCDKKAHEPRFRAKAAIYEKVYTMTSLHKS